jgi:hypothetical protein
MATLGAEIVFIAPGEVQLAFPFAKQFCQQNGFMHTMLSTIIVRPRSSAGTGEA